MGGGGRGEKRETNNYPTGTGEGGEGRGVGGDKKRNRGVKGEVETGEDGDW